MIKAYVFAALLCMAGALQVHQIPVTTFPSTNEVQVTTAFPLASGVPSVSDATPTDDVPSASEGSPTEDAASVEGGEPGGGWCVNGRLVAKTFCMNPHCQDVGTRAFCGSGPNSEGICCVMNIKDTVCRSAHHINCALPERAFSLLGAADEEEQPMTTPASAVTAVTAASNDRVAGPNWCRDGRLVANMYCMNTQCQDVGSKVGCGSGPNSAGVCCVKNIMDTTCQSVHHISCALPERAFSLLGAADEEEQPMTTPASVVTAVTAASNDRVAGPNWCRDGRLVANMYCMNTQCQDVGSKLGCGSGPNSEGVCCVKNVVNTTCQSVHHISCSLPERAFSLLGAADEEEQPMTTPASVATAVASAADGRVAGPGWCRNGRLVANMYCMNEECQDVGTKDGCGSGPNSEGDCCIKNIMDSTCSSAHHTSCSLPERAFS